jgi:hypothetical protein
MRSVLLLPRDAQQRTIPFTALPVTSLLVPGIHADSNDELMLGFVAVPDNPKLRLPDQS